LEKESKMKEQEFAIAGLNSDGMTIRAWLAGHALSGYLALHAGPDNGCPTPDCAAKHAVEFADALLAELEKEKTP
jgi:hypothetical protein